ncbi:Sterol O-acyltransferase 1, partial [Stegodyphus mimosarum]
MMFSTVFIFYPVFRFWSNTRFIIWKRRLYNSIFCFSFIIYQTAFLIIPAKIVLNCDIPPASTFIVICEQLRLMMKTHTFVRENAARVLTFKPHQDNDKNDFRLCPEVQKFIYFLFAPTLLYEDNYPRTGGTAHRLPNFTVHGI